jgi:(p)ppGpp synthase/HD superfamily hydrolase
MRNVYTPNDTITLGHVDPLIRKAIIFAARKHDGQVRKGTDIPYITHPMEVMQILTVSMCPVSVIVAGILHDVLEDTKTSPVEIIEQFGEGVLKIIIAESEDKSKPWKERKQATIDHLPGASYDVKLVCCADKLSNLESMAADMEAVGDRLWERFNASKEDIGWYYKGVIDALAAMGNAAMYQDLKALYAEVFK